MQCLRSVQSAIKNKYLNAPRLQLTLYETSRNPKGLALNGGILAAGPCRGHSSASSISLPKFFWPRFLKFAEDKKPDSKDLKSDKDDDNKKVPENKKGDEDDSKDKKKEKDKQKKADGSGGWSSFLKIGKKKDSEDDSNPDSPDGPLTIYEKGSMLALIASVALAYFVVAELDNPLLGLQASQEITLATFLQDVLAKEAEVSQIEGLYVDPERKLVRVMMKGSPPRLGYFFSIGTVDGFEAQLADAQHQLGRNPLHLLPVNYYKPKLSYMELGGALLLVALSAGLVYFQLHGRGMMRFMDRAGGRGGNRFTFIKPGSAGGQRSMTTFQDVAGMHEAKLEIMEFVQFLKNPAKYTALGARIPRGALLMGPPGTGKTLLARATAGEANVPFLSVAGSEFMELFVGTGPARVRELFAKARAEAPCIVFIDEIDAIGKSRHNSLHDERDNTLNQILVEMDGFNTSEKPVIILAGTNRADVLDKALLRPGRFDRKIPVDLPTMQDRVEILQVHLKPLKTADDKAVVAARLSSLTAGCSGADLANICNEAAIIAARHGKAEVQLEDFMAAIDRQVAGIERKSRRMAEDERRTVSYHEAGHALTGWLLEHAHPLMKVTIVPHGQALGYAAYNPKDRHILTTAQLLDEMCVTLGGRISEQLVFGRITTGALDDLERVTHQAYSQISELGMSAQLGHLAFEDEDNDKMVYSGKTARIIDEEVRKLVNTAYSRTEELLRGHLQQLKAIADELFTKEVLYHEDLVRLVGPRPWPEPMDWRAYLPKPSTPSANGTNATEKEAKPAAS